MKNSVIVFVLGMIYPSILIGQAGSKNQAGSQPDSIITWKYSGDTDSVLSYKILYQYDPQNRLTETEAFLREQAANLWEPYRIETMEFDDAGRQTLWAVMYWEKEYMAYKGLFRTRTIFDAHDNIIESYYDGWSYAPFDWKQDKKEIRTFDTQNKLIDQVLFEWDNQNKQWDSTGYNILTYNAQGLLESNVAWEIAESTGNFYPKIRHDYEYDNNENVTRMTRRFYNPGTQLWYNTFMQEYAWDEFHRKTNVWYWLYEESIEKWFPQEKDIYAWNDAGSMTLYENYNIGEDTVTWIPSMKSEMVYNSENRITKHTGYRGNAQGNWTPGYMREYEYTQDTLLISEVLTQWDSLTGTWKIQDQHIYALDSLNRRYSDSYYKWIVHVQQVVLSTRDYYFYSPQGSHGSEENGQPGNPGQYDVQVFPNPTTGRFSVQTIKAITGILRIEIRNLQGTTLETVATEQILPVNSLEFDISHWPAGLYFIKIQTGNRTLVKQLVKI